MIRNEQDLTFAIFAGSLALAWIGHVYRAINIRLVKHRHDHD